MGWGGVGCVWWGGSGVGSGGVGHMGLVDNT